jgi:hypothetical protein
VIAAINHAEAECERTSLDKCINYEIQNLVCLIPLFVNYLDLVMYTEIELVMYIMSLLVKVTAESILTNLGFEIKDWK